jgi:ankyrin repeat protein
MPVTAFYLAGATTMTMRRPTIVELLVVASIVTVLVILLQPVTGRMSPLCLAASKGDVSEVRSLLDNGFADIKEHDGRGRTPLHYAVSYGQANAVKLLLDKGADADARNHWQQTPLHVAASLGNIEVVRVLVVGGADLNSQGSGGYTPLDEAEFRAARLAETNAELKKWHKDAQATLNDADRASCDEVIKFLVAKGAKRSSALKDRR